MFVSDASSCLSVELRFEAFCVRDAEVAGSNPVAPTITIKRVRTVFVTFKTVLFPSMRSNSNASTPSLKLSGQ